MNFTRIRLALLALLLISPIIPQTGAAQAISPSKAHSVPRYTPTPRPTIAKVTKEIVPQEEEQAVSVSPKAPWGEFNVVSERPPRDPWYIQILLWVPNRVMDFIDIFRVDAGLGPSYGGVLRVSKYAQVGYRHVNPASVRVGAFGRQAPFLVERADEKGFGPNFKNSRDRTICPGEVGVGADLFIAGVYGGICTEEVADFIAGIFFLDIMHDDLK